jgi:hypothetical protein
MIIRIALLILTTVYCTFSSAQKTETVYLDPRDSSSNVYVVIYPPKSPWKGYMFLVPGMFQRPADVLVQTDLPKHAAQQGVLTIIPTFKTGIGSFGVDTATQSSLQQLLDHVIGKYKLSNEPFYLGGFSIGGTCALKYAELAIRDNYKIKPAAVFAIDSPLDFERMYLSMEREERLNPVGSPSSEETVYMINRFNKEFGGSPRKVQHNYHRISPYSFNDTAQYAIKPLKSLPLRLYTEPDVTWWLNEGIDYTGMNSIDFAALANELRRLGNKKVELITTSNKGFRKPANTKHPHSWSIVDPVDLVKWLMLAK